MIEFFFDDSYRNCYRCRSRVEKGYAQLLKDYGCALWCSSAEKCLGSEVYKRFEEARRRHEEHNTIDDIVK